MKIKLLILSLLFGLLYNTAKGAEYQITESDAIDIACREINKTAVNCYILQEKTETSVWTVFVDAEPMKGWCHDAYIITIPKTSSETAANTVATKKEYLDTPPYGNYVCKKIYNPSGNAQSPKPIVAAGIMNGSNSQAKNTYAVIISGGANKFSNYERYWNDCSFIYKTLRKRYGIAKDHIIPIMSDGTDPEPDMLLNTGYVTTQPLDLDGDGLNDIQLPATKGSVNSAFRGLLSQMHADDHLFVYVIDHGGTHDGKKQSFIYLWDYDTLEDYELANILKDFTSKKVNVSVVLGQCYSGGFLDDLNEAGCVVAAACEGSEQSYACYDLVYDEFVYQWTSAMNGASPYGSTVNADRDSNGYISMEEAFDYAYYEDRIGFENPVYKSTPRSIGEDLAFNHTPEAVDLYVMSSEGDTGSEPNILTDIMWNSPSIVVRNNDDDKFEYENPEFSKDHQFAFIYVRVYNRGKEDYTSGKYMHVYWADASLAITKETWKGREVYINEYGEPEDPTGGHLEATSIPAIPAGGYVDVKVRWPMPNILGKYEDGNYHFCLFAKIMDISYDDGYDPEKAYFNPREDNDQAQKNVTIIYKKDIDTKSQIFIRNINTSDAVYSIELIPQTSADAAFFSTSTVQMNMSNRIYSAWERGGFQSQGVETYAMAGTSPRPITFTSADNSIQSVSLAAKEFDKVDLQFNFDKSCTTKDKYTFNLIQRNEAGEIVGGETYIVYNPYFGLIVIKPDPGIGGVIQLSVDGSQYDSLQWSDDMGNNLGEGETINVNQSTKSRTFNVTGTMENGITASGSITLESVSAIQSVSASANTIEVKLITEAPENATMSITSLIDGTTKYETTVPAGTSDVKFNTPGLSSGLYVATYKIDDEIIDRSKFNVR